MPELPQRQEDDDQNQKSEEISGDAGRSRSPSEPSGESPEPQPFSAERKVARKYIQGTAQSLIQWMPMGGSGWALVSFLRQQDWGMALLMFPVMCVTVIWAAYTKSVLTRLEEVYQQRGREDVDSLMSWQKKLDEAIRWQLAGTDDKYLRCQGNACLYHSTEGLASTFKPLLKDVFVPLDLSGDFFRGVDGEPLPMRPGFKWDKQIIEQLNQKGDLRIWNVFKRAKQYPGYRCLAILAWGGYGKTTLLRHITYTYTQKRHQKYKAPKLLPVLLYLRKWQKVIAQEKLDLPTLIEKHHIPSLPEGEGLKLPPNWAKNQLRDGEMLIMFDGFDEVREEWRHPISQWIGNAMTNYQQSFFILTSRPAGYRSYASENKPNSLFIKAFNDDQQEKFIKRWYLSRERHISAQPDSPVVAKEAAAKSASLVRQLRERPELNDLAKNPLLLNIIVNLHSHAPSDPSDLSRQIQLPQRRTELYREIFRLQLGDRPLVKQINMVLEASQSQQILQKLALSMVQSHQPTIEGKPLLEQLQIHLNLLDEQIAAPTFLKQIEQVSELLVKGDENYEFAHLSFQAYLAAVEIKERQQEGLLLQHWQDSWWKETILLYIARVNPNKFIRELCKIGSIEAVGLAYECLKESRPGKVDAEVASQVQQLRYQPLENYLKNGQWKEADMETARVMLQTVGKEESEYLYPNELENFPCDDLLAIDRLWVKYSQGRFGFSVQAKIYRDLGGTREYNEEIWIAFCDRIGWRKDGDWMDYENLTFTTTAPLAYLPRGGVRKIVTPFGTFVHSPLGGGNRLGDGVVAWGGRGGRGNISSLAWRLAKCNR